MPRPSLKETRSEEILEAFMRCVARYGLDGSTLERISHEAGIGRPLLRHYLGNRSEMVKRLLDHVLYKFEHLSSYPFDSLPDENRLQAVLKTLFEREHYSAENAAVFQALVAASERYEDTRKPLMNFVMNFEKRLAGEIMREKPQAGIEACNIAASGIAAIYFNTAAIMPLKPPQYWRRYQTEAAKKLLIGL